MLNRPLPYGLGGRECAGNLRVPGYLKGEPRPMAGRRTMAEETRFWGVVLPRWPAHLLPPDTGFLPWPEFVPDGKPVHHYPLFSSKEKAEEFVHERLTLSDQQLMEATLMNIRRIYRDEIPDEHYVSLDGGGLVRWGELL